MTLAQKYVVSELRSVKSLFLLYQNAAALLLYFPAAAGWLRRFGITRYHATLPTRSPLPSNAILLSFAPLSFASLFPAR